MTMRTMIGILLLLATPAGAQTVQPPITVTPPATESVAPPPVPAVAPPLVDPAKRFRTQTIAMQTSVGTITLALEVERAPLTSANFLRYVDQKRLDGTGFYRALRYPGSPAGLIQGGVRGDPKRTLKPVAHEPTTKTGLSNTDGVISLARAAPGSATADFFIILGDLSGLDAKPGAPGDNLGFAAFGHVVDGMDVVRAIQAGTTSPTAGEGAMKGQMLSAPVKIISVRRVADAR